MVQVERVETRVYVEARVCVEACERVKAREGDECVDACERELVEYVEALVVVVCVDAREQLVERVEALEGELFVAPLVEE